MINIAELYRKKDKGPSPMKSRNNLKANTITDGDLHSAK